MTDNIESQYILLNTYLTDEEHFDSLVSILKSDLNIDKIADRASYILRKESRAIDIIGAGNLAEVSALLENQSLQADEALLRDVMTHDIRREIVKLHTPVKPLKNIIPTGEKIQLRYIEVPGFHLNEYFDWRIKTIFANVLSRDEITGFSAYHSVVSAQPGVTFFVEYDGSYEDLMKGFTSEEYNDIVEQANRFIVGGNKNLYLRPYDRIYLAKSLSEQKVLDMAEA